jgi:signal transduction histidine kinase
MKTRPVISIISKNEDIQNTCLASLDGERFSIRLADTLQYSGVNDVDAVIVDAAILSDDPASTDILANLNSNRPKAVCIILSGSSTWAKAMEFVKSGAYDLIPLPVIPELLTLRIERALDWQTKTAEVKRLQIMEQDVSHLWSVTKGELEASELFEKDFLAPSAFRLTVAHEFRAPITALQSFLLILLKGYVPHEKWGEMIQHALDRSEDLLNLVDNLLDLATARQEMSSENLAVVRLGDELEKILPSFKTEADEKKISLNLTIQHNPAVEVHPGHMQHLWTNLISNAIKYTPAGGRIDVALDQMQGYAVGEIKDTGIGISPRDLPLIFNEFFRTAEAKQMERRGTGLGLPLVKRLVEGYAGKIEVRSTLGEGSLFRFMLPLALIQR